MLIDTDTETETDTEESIEDLARTQAQHYVDVVAAEQSLCDAERHARGGARRVIGHARRVARAHRERSHSIAVEAIGLLFASGERGLAISILSDMWDRVNAISQVSTDE